MWTRLILSVVLALGGWAWAAPSVHAGCEVRTTLPTYANLTFLNAEVCNANGQTGGGGAPGSATAASPTLIEGEAGRFSWDLLGNLRVTLGSLLSGEDQGTGGDTSLIRTSGGTVRGTEGNILNSAVGNATSAAFTMFTGPKLLTARITGAGSVAQVITIYGGTESGMAAATSDIVCTITLSGTSGGAGTAYSCPPFVAPFKFYIAVTSGSTGTPTTILTAQY